MLVGPLGFDPVHRCLYSGSRKVTLAPSENSLLYFLTVSAGKVVTKEAIYDYVLPTKARRACDTSVEHCVYAVRRKLAAADPSWNYIHTHYRVGYRLEPEPVASHS